ncbi:MULTISPECIES: class I SAM-dependent methyltransferase [Kordiimonas]|jgi:2-polyprenyl-3-methyl-5-hydroxy-6-metoxy-1,4-benzoquinol methylase|uniref:class I SAM-dependent methyltransferase n=1 Tax=Kordiimonas TaxID=288021 RepID=UPI0025799873|nr:class I SAM-dependent methyltransferase [Kordiimonas sp. UBA4487]
MTSREQHWQHVYETKTPNAVSWYQVDPALSLGLIDGLHLPEDAAIVDVGAGASVLADRLLDRGFSDLTLVDLAASALAHTRDRLGARAAAVEFIPGDVTRLSLGHKVDLWHDRAVLHFLTSADDRARYRGALDAHLKPGGHAIIATFAVGGPEKCSGLPVRQYDAARLMDLLGDGYELVNECFEEHTTPWGSTQAFACFLVRKVA